MAEMSGYWTSDGHELTVNELFESRRRNRAWRSDKRFRHCEKSFLWLMNALGLKTSFGLDNMLRQIEVEGSAMFYFPPRVIERPGGGVRIIISPKPEFRLVQRRIHLLLKRTFKRPPHAFGFRGGSCMDLVWRHKNSQSTLKFDIKDAFFKVGYTRVRSSLSSHRRYQLNPSFKWLSGYSRGFSGSIAHWIARLCTYAPISKEIAKFLPRGAYSFLPQGAPTSPICFDLACAKLDKKLARIAERIGGVMSRYADNYYFSMPTSEISPKLEAMIICSTRKRYGFPIHKVRTADEGELCRILGYNLTNGQIRNTREFLRKLRGALYVLQTKLDRDLDWEDAYRRVRGFMGFAADLPGNLQKIYEYCESKIASL